MMGTIMGFAGVVMFQFFAFYFYFSSEQFWYTGLLIATNGAMQVLATCDGFSDSPWQVYQALLDQVVAIVCCMAADILLAPPSPSHLACNAFNETEQLAHRALVKLLNPEKGATVELHRDVFFSKLRFADARGAEAELEPRFVRTPWRHELWQVLLHHTFKLVRKLTIMEYVAAKTSFDEAGGRDEPQGRRTVRTTIMRKMLSQALRPRLEAPADIAPRKESVAALLRRPLFQRAAEALLARRKLVFDMAYGVLMHETAAPLTESKGHVQRLVQGQKAERLVDAKEIAEEREAIVEPSNEVANEVGHRRGSYGRSPSSSTARDWEAANEVGTFLLMLELSTRDLDAMAEAIALAPEMSLDEIAYAAVHPPRRGLLREVTGGVGEAVQSSADALSSLRGSIGALVARLEGAAGDKDDDDDSPPPSPRAQESRDNLQSDGRRAPQ